MSSCLKRNKTNVILTKKSDINYLYHFYGFAICFNFDPAPYVLLYLLPVRILFF